MAWIKVPPAHHPLFRDALPEDPRVVTLPMFGGIAAKVNGHMFAGLFARSVVLLLPEADRPEALALDGATIFDPMDRGWSNSNKIMLPEDMMDDAEELRAWIRRAFTAAAARPPKGLELEKPSKRKTPAAKRTALAAKRTRPVARTAPAAPVPGTGKPTRRR